MNCVSSTGNKILLTYLLTYVICIAFVYMHTVFQAQKLYTQCSTVLYCTVHTVVHYIVAFSLTVTGSAFCRRKFRIYIWGQCGK